MLGNVQFFMLTYFFLCFQFVFLLFRVGLHVVQINNTSRCPNSENTAQWHSQPPSQVCILIKSSHGLHFFAVIKVLCVPFAVMALWKEDTSWSYDSSCRNTATANHSPQMRRVCLFGKAFLEGICFVLSGWVWSIHVTFVFQIQRSSSVSSCTTFSPWILC